MISHFVGLFDLSWIIATLFCCAATSEPILQQREEAPVITPSTLKLQVGQSLELGLRLPNGEGWSQVNIGQFMVREPGRQRTLEPVILQGRDTVSIELDRPGFALIVIDVGPSSDKGHRDSWQRTTHCTKLVVHVEGPSAHLIDRNPGLTAKVGGKIEILPLLDPTTLLPGSDLPVRIYFEGDKQVGQKVTVISPAEEKATYVSDGVGAATVRIPRPGRWILRYEKESEGRRYLADLMFDVPGEAGAGKRSTSKEVQR